MFIETRGMGFPLTDAIHRHVEARVEAALGPVARWVRTVTARLEDVNAQRGGIDKRCSLVVVIRRHGVVAAEATDADLYLAVGEAATRARRAVFRALGKRVARERTDPQRPGALLSR